MIDPSRFYIRHPTRRDETVSLLRHLVVCWAVIVAAHAGISWACWALNQALPATPPVVYDVATASYRPVHPAHFAAGKPFVVLRDDELILKPQ